MRGNHKHFTLERTISLRRVVGHVLQISAVLVLWIEQQAYFSISAHLFVDKGKVASLSWGYFMSPTDECNAGCGCAL